MSRRKRQPMAHASADDPLYLEWRLRAVFIATTMVWDPPSTTDALLERHARRIRDAARRLTASGLPADLQLAALEGLVDELGRSHPSVPEWRSIIDRRCATSLRARARWAPPGDFSRTGPHAAVLSDVMPS